MVSFRSFTPLIAVAGLLMAGALAVCTAKDPFVFQDGDRVVLIGSTLIEREQKYGYWELFLTLKNRENQVSFRNLGWSGDTVHAEARGRFDYANPAKCREQLISLTKALKPTVIIICYGHNESFEGKAGVPKFIAGLNQLLDELQSIKARIVLMSPTRFGSSPALPDPSPRNADLALYCDTLRQVAERRQLEFVDLFERVGEPLTENGLHLTEDGYRAVAEKLGARFSPELEPLRQAIVAKNQLFFHRWRPQNETYLFGFRKHEQGKNAAEVAQFDPLVAEAEKKIGELRTRISRSAHSPE